MDNTLREIVGKDPLLDSDEKKLGFAMGFDYVIKNFDFYKKLKSDADKYREIVKLINKK